MQAVTDLPFSAIQPVKTGVLEKFSESKWGAHCAEDNEDAVVAGPPFSAVIDGISDHYGQRFRSGTTGRIAMKLVKGIFSTLPADADEPAFRAEAIAALARSFGPGQPTEKRPGVAAVVYSHYRRELWCYADPIVLAFDGGGRPLLDFGGDKGRSAAAQARVRINARMLAAGEITTDSLYRRDPGLESQEVKALLTGPSPKLNTPGGVVVLNGTELPDGCTVKVVKLPEDAVTLVLATDGYPRQLMQADDFLSLARVERQLREINARDPHCLGINAGVKGIMERRDDERRTWKRAVSYDDRSYLRIRL